MPSQELQKLPNIRQYNISVTTFGIVLGCLLGDNIDQLFIYAFRGNDGHSTDSSISERLYGVGSEEELSNGSGNVSPRSRRANKHLGRLVKG